MFDGHSYTLFIQIIHNNAVKSRFYDPKYAVTNFTHKLITVNLIWRNRANRILNSVLRTGPFNTSYWLRLPLKRPGSWERFLGYFTGSGSNLQGAVLINIFYRLRLLLKRPRFQIPDPCFCHPTLIFRFFRNSPPTHQLM